MPSTKITVEETAKFIKAQTQLILQRKKILGSRPQAGGEGKTDYTLGKEYSLARAMCDYRESNKELISTNLNRFSHYLAWQFAEDKDTDEKFLAKYLMELLKENSNRLPEKIILPMILVYTDEINSHFQCNEGLLFSEIAKLLDAYAGCWAEYHGSWFAAFEAAKHSNSLIDDAVRLARTEPFLAEQLTYVRFQLKSSSSDRVVVKDVRKKLSDKNFIDEMKDFLSKYGKKEKEEKSSEDILSSFVCLADPIAGVLSCLAPEPEKPEESPLETFIQNTIAKSRDIYDALINVLAFVYHINGAWTQDEFYKTVVLLFDKYGYDAVEKEGGWDKVLQIGTQSKAEYVLSRAGFYKVKSGVYEICDVTRDAFCQFVEYLTASEQKDAPKQSPTLRN